MIKRIQFIVEVIRKAVQRSLTTVFLVLLYIVGFGLTALTLRVIKPGFLSKKFTVDNASWREASGYDVDGDGNLRQS